jgi:hypothetical protein
MKIHTLIALFFTSSIAFSQPKKDSTIEVRLSKIEMELNKNRAVNIENEISILKDKLDFQQKITEQSNSNISNQLDSASYNLTIFGLLFGIGAIALGLYVTYIERKIVKIGEENKTLLNKNQKIKEDVEELNRLIQSDIYNLFLKIKREETAHIINRLCTVPKDISNVLEALLSREIEQEHFPNVRKAYLLLEDKDKSYRNGYHYLFFQHFITKALLDDNIRKDFKEFIPKGVKQSFENDILNTIKDFAILIVDKGIQNYKEELNLVFNGLSNSDYKKYNDLYIILQNNLQSKKNNFEAFNAIESSIENRLAKIEFGKILQSTYQNDNLSESEILVFEELKTLETAQQLADEEEKLKLEEQKRKNEERNNQREERKRQQAEKRNNNKESKQ